MIDITEKNNLDVINFTNISDEDYEGMWGGEIAVIKAGETKPFPRFLAYHYTKHLIDKMLLGQGLDHGDELLREPLEKRILGEISITPEIPDKEEKEETFAGLKDIDTEEETEEDIEEDTKEEIKEAKPKKRGKK